MRYKIETFGDIDHMERNKDDSVRARPYSTSEKTYANTDTLVQHLELKSQSAKKSHVYRVTPLGDPFVVEVNVDVVVASHVGSTS